MRRIIIALAAGQALQAQAPAAYRITQTFTLGGEGSWDYVIPDPPNHRLFIGRQTRVMVVDATWVERRVGRRNGGESEKSP